MGAQPSRTYGGGVSWFIGAPLTLAASDARLVPQDAGAVALTATDRHVTLVFLGSVPEDVALRAWQAVPALDVPAEVSAWRWARFGKSALALELSDGTGRLETAATACRHATRAHVDVRVPSAFRPHVTMARVPRRSRPPSAAALAAWPLPTQPLTVGPVTLFRSTGQPTGDRYEVVAQQTGAD